MKLLLLNGPNLNLTGRRETEIYGRTTLADIEKKCRDIAAAHGAELECFQSNHEGALIDKIQQVMGECDGIVMNPGALTHYPSAPWPIMLFAHTSSVTDTALKGSLARISLICTSITGISQQATASRRL